MFLYHYTQLNTSQKKMYDAIYQGATNFDKTVSFPCAFGASSSGLQKVIYALQEDHPELFYLDFSISITGGLGFTTAHLKYLFKKEEAKKYKNQLSSVLNRIVARAKTIKGEYEKVLFVHDLLAENIVYDLNAPNAHNALGTLVDGRAVCQGISYAVKMIFDELGIDSTSVSGEVNTRLNRGPHSWNLVKVNNRWYHLDVTLDLKQNGTVFHTYFLLNDDDAMIHHRYREKTNIECKYINDNYFYRNKAFFTKFEDAADYIVKELKAKGKAEVKMLKIGYDDATQKLMRAISKRSHQMISYFVSSNVDFQVYIAFKR